ncbi:hypothetical protein SORBI_3003G279900 [Sorghum bicolor]|uniref:UDP N-acetylglucosamine O-acyltransferase C-terminal domain-containing protein n=1 Tax=Sorghum bicolor TaxID=4558 RepID=A0A1W0VZA6_SORBI|nr:hypothetical protein SORBI_3003G279900 [Sorghum bicolor]
MSAAAAAVARAARRYFSSRLHTTTTRLLHASDSQAAPREASGSFIHPAAVVHPDAAIGQGVSIGPFCTVGPSARVGDACQLHAGSHVVGDTELGEGCVVQTGAILGADIPGRTIIGENNVIGHYAVVGAKCQDLKYKDWTHTAGAVVVHQFCHIGSYSFLGGGSVVAQDVPRYMMVAGDRAELRGLNIEGLKRNGFSDQEEQEIELSESPAVSCMVESIRMSFVQGHRGICKFRSWNSS